MLYLFHGTDVDRVRTKAFEWVAKARTKEPNLAYVRLAREELTDAALEDAALSGGLFVSRLLILIDDPYVGRTTSYNDETEEGDNNEGASASVLDEHLDALAASDNAIVILAPKLGAVKAKKLVPKVKLEYKLDAPVAHADARGFNSGLVNALESRSREKLWLEVNRALRAGDAPEMLHGLLHWKVRDLMDMPAGRQGRAGVWTRDESRQLSFALIELLQASRRGGLGLSLALEKWALSI